MKGKWKKKTGIEVGAEYVNIEEFGEYGGWSKLNCYNFAGDEC